MSTLFTPRRTTDVTSGRFALDVSACAPLDAVRHSDAVTTDSSRIVLSTRGVNADVEVVLAS
jgi:hypothetical protein